MSHRKFVAGMVLMFFFVLTFGSYSPAGAAGPNSKQVVIIDFPRLIFTDLIPAYPVLNRLARTGTVGILAARHSGIVTPEKAYLSLNSGKQLWAGEDSRLIFGNSEIYNGMAAGELYRSLTGYRPNPGGASYLGMPKTIKLNQKNEPVPEIGLIGKIFNENFVKTAVIGNADTAEYPNRTGAILVVDDQGLIDLAAIGPETNVNDPGFPSGLRSDPEKLLIYYKQLATRARVLVVSLGDLERVERYRDYFTESRWAYFRKQALRRYDQFLGKLLAQIDPAQTMVVLFSAISPEVKDESQKLNPLIIRSPDLKPGVIYSSSTRRNGLLTGPDLFAKIFSFLGIPDPPGFTGRTLRSVPGNWRQMEQLQAELDTNYQIRWPLLTGYAYTLIFLVLAVIFILILRPESWKLLKVIHNVYLFLLTFPVVFLWEALISPLNWPEIAGYTVGLAGLLYLGIKIFTGEDRITALTALSGVTVASIMIDGFGNGYLELRSFWGYSAVSAARFYGVGNEYLGFLLGAYIVLITITFERFRRHAAKILWSGWILIAVFLFYPIFGANIGGGITASIGLGVTNFLLLGQPVKQRQVLFLGGALLLLMTLVGIGDFLIFGKQMSHFGQLLRLVQDQGIGAVTELAFRKWRLNITLITYTGWSYVLLAVLGLIPFLYKKPPPPVLKLMGRYPVFTKGILGFIVTCVIAFLANDSGIVTAATMFIFGFDLFLVLAIKECHLRNVTQGR
jgi:hypothetical protein